MISRTTAFLLALFLSASHVTAEQPVFRAGAATADITPEAGVSLDGTISKNGPVLGVHDRLFARALVLNYDQTSVAIVVADACMIGRETIDVAKKLAQQATGIPKHCMLVSATHSHAAVRAIHIGKRPADAKYHKTLSEQIATAISRAHSNLAPAVVGYGTVEKPDLFACRRFLCKPGTVSPNPFGETGERVKSVSSSSAEIIRPAGPIDPAFSVLSIRHADGTPLAVLANFSAHYCGGYQRGQVSADYFGAFARQLEQHQAVKSNHPPFVAVMSNGTSGDSGATTLPGKFAPFEKMKEVGRQLAGEANRIINGLEYESPPHGIAAAQTEIDLSVRLPNQARVEWARRMLDEGPAKDTHRWSKIYAQETLELADFDTTERIVMQAMRIGDIGIAAIPCEVFGETGLAIKKTSPLKRTFTVELANGYNGYLPTPEQHLLGGYETWPARSSHLEIEAEPKIRREILRLLKEVDFR